MIKDLLAILGLSYLFVGALFLLFGSNQETYISFCDQCVESGQFYPEEDSECSERCICSDRFEFNVTDYEQLCIIYLNESYEQLYRRQVINSTCFNVTQYNYYSIGACTDAIERRPSALPHYGRIVCE